MSKTEFLREYGVDFRKFANKPIFAALLAMIDAESPAKTTPSAEGDRLHGAAVFLNEIYGWEKLRRLLADLPTVPDKPFEPEDKFDESEKI